MSRGRCSLAEIDDLLTKPCEMGAKFGRVDRFIGELFAPKPYTEAKLVGPLAADAPDEELIEPGFYEDPQHARGELPKTKRQQDPFEGTAEGNVIILEADKHTGVLFQSNLQEVRNLLRRC